MWWLLYTSRMIDTHCHLTYDGLHERVEQVLGAARQAGVTRMVCVGTTPPDAQAAVRLAERHDDVYATVGLHPHYAAQWRDGPLLGETMTQLARHPRVVALGEMGLDRHYPDPPLAVQQRALETQLAFAAGGDLPIIIHNREATADTLAVLRASGIAPARFVFHCFTGTRAELDEVLAFGAMVSFTGIVTFRNAGKIAAAALATPLERLMVETDSPYLAPEPFRKVRPNEPRYVVEVARFLAQQRGMNETDFIAAVDANAQRFFRLP